MKMVDITVATPKSLEVANILTENILSSKIVDGTRLQSIRELARTFNVSNKVAECAVNILEERSLVVKESTRGTFIKKRSLSNPIKTIGLITYFSQNTIEHYYESMSDVLNDHNCSCFIHHWQPDSNNDLTKQVKGFVKQNADAYIIDIPFYQSINEIIELTRHKPLCLLHEFHQDMKKFTCPAVFSDPISRVTQAFSFLLEKGHREMLIIGHHSELFERERKIIRKAAENVGLDFSSLELQYATQQDFEINLERIERIFSGEHQPTALIGMSDYITYLFQERLTLFKPKHKISEAIGAYDTTWSKQPGKEFHTFNMNFKLMWEKALEILKHGGEKKPYWVKPTLKLKNVLVKEI